MVMLTGSPFIISLFFSYLIKRRMIFCDTLQASPNIAQFIAFWYIHLFAMMYMLQESNIWFFLWQLFAKFSIYISPKYLRRLSNFHDFWVPIFVKNVAISSLKYPKISIFIEICRVLHSWTPAPTANDYSVQSSSWIHSIPRRSNWHLGELWFWPNYFWWSLIFTRCFFCKQRWKLSRKYEFL